ncbi:Flp pilus assembly protein CpaB [Agrococcus lahaulensis]|uniref:Flp pilus assembly protein CpaB n=1 Tax=Agrococcus sediminis TaxID=2599924 RepID=UPI000FE2B7ED|nr:Flp pilus assembly protein CpaB [Agrococcus lahaulensis]
MIRRLIISLVAVLIAAIGGVLTFLYASSADARAMARMEPAQVLVVAEPIPEGTSADTIARSLVVSEIPAAAVVPGAVVDLADVAGMQTTTDLQPGEQLIAARFVAPEAVADEVEVPANMHQLSIRLDSQRVIGGELRAGDTVGLFVSGEISGTDEEGATMAGTVTNLILHKVLVVDVQGAATTTTNEAGEEVEQPSADLLMVTLALSAPDAELVVFAQEFGSIWLSLEGAEVPEDGTRIVTPEVLFQ